MNNSCNSLTNKKDCTLDIDCNWKLQPLKPGTKRRKGLCISKKLVQSPRQKKATPRGKKKATPGGKKKATPTPKKKKKTVKKNRLQKGHLGVLRDVKTDLSINSEFHGSMAHTNDISREKHKIHTIKPIIDELQVAISKINVSKFFKLFKDTILSNQETKIKSNILLNIYGGVACDKWLEVLNPKIHQKFIELYPTEDIDCNILINGDHIYHLWTKETTENGAKRKGNLNQQVLVDLKSFNTLKKTDTLLESYNKSIVDTPSKDTVRVYIPINKRGTVINSKNVYLDQIQDNLTRNQKYLNDIMTKLEKILSKILLKFSSNKSIVNNESSKWLYNDGNQEKTIHLNEFEYKFTLPKTREVPSIILWKKQYSNPVMKMLNNSGLNNFSHYKILIDGHFKSLLTYKTCRDKGDSSLKETFFKSYIPHIYNRININGEVDESNYEELSNRTIVKFPNDPIYYDNLSILLIEQLESIINSQFTTELQNKKCRIRYARVYYLLKSIKEYTGTIKPDWEWPSPELIKKAEEILKKHKSCQSVDIMIQERL